MSIVLSMKDKLLFIDGSMKKPDDASLDLINFWIQNNNVVMLWILNSVSKEISAGVIYASTAYQIWNDLKERFQQHNGPRIYQLRKDPMNLTQDRNNVSVYFIRLKTIWEELSHFRPNCNCRKCSCGGVKKINEYYQMDYIMSFLMGLNESFPQARGQTYSWILCHQLTRFLL